MRPRHLLALFAIAAAPLDAQQLASTRPGRSEPAVVPARAGANAAVAVRAERPPVLDARSDDALWATAQVIDAFRMFDPREDADPRFRTEARVAYDAHNLYVLVRAFDPRPDSIVGLLARRDNRTSSDDIKVMVDGYHDRRTGFAFAVNPAGVKRDVYIFNDGEEDLSWDGVWDVATAVDSLGWTAEFRIPLSQIRFPKAEKHTFGIMLTREIVRYNERMSWPLLRRGKGGLASQFGDLGGIERVATPRRLEVAPYTVAKTYNAPAGASRFAQRSVGTVGADIKYGITSNLTLDATVNPDFGQVEADPSVLNLGTVETFLPEKRPFFLEGQGIFRFDLNCNDGVCSGLFYSRRIGRQPQLTYDYWDASNPQASTILGAAKLTGRLSNGMSVGIMNATTDREVAPGDRTIEPRTNYFVGRVQQDLGQGKTAFGVMATTVNRSLDEFTEGSLRRNAYVGGVDFRHQFLDRNFEVSTAYAHSVVQGTADAIAGLQRSLVHNYTRPDDDLTYDPGRTSLDGGVFQVGLSKRGGGITRGNLNYQMVTPGFEANDVGYLGRANRQSQSFWFQWQWREPRWIYRWWNFNVNQWAGWTADGLRLDFGGNVNTHMQLRNNWWLHLGQNVNSPVPTYCDACARGGPAIRRSLGVNGWGGIEGDSRKFVTPFLWFNWGVSDEGESWWYGVDPEVSLRLASRFSMSLGAGWSRDRSAWQFKRDLAPVDQDVHYTFAPLDQTTLSATARVNFTATPALSLQIYAQPYVSGGDYGPWMELRDPRAPRFADRFQPYRDGMDPGALSFKQFRSNTVVRWEYRPGSVLYLVWAQERGHYDESQTTQRFRARDDYESLFRLHPGNVLLVKGSYWLNF